MSYSKAIQFFTPHVISLYFENDRSYNFFYDEIPLKDYGKIVTATG